MASLLFKLNQVPDDEADDIRHLLDEANIDFYETSPGRWGLSFAAIWIKDETQMEPAQALLDEYQQQRQLNARQNWQELVDSGNAPNRWQVFIQSPNKILALAIFVLALFYISIAPFYPL